MVQVTETTLEQIRARLNSMRTSLNKIDYLESALKKDLSLEIKKFISNQVAELYEKERMFEKAARAMSNKSRFETTFKERIQSCIISAELFCKIGKIEDAEEMFSRAAREGNEIQKLDIIRERKNMYLKYATYLERVGKRSSSLKFYEKLIKIRLEPAEKEQVREKLIKTYKLLGRFKDAELVSRT